jgi:transposase
MSGSISKDNIVVVETRRRWTDGERQQALDEMQHFPVSAVARKHGMTKSLLFRWRKEAGLTGKRSKIEGLVPVRIAAANREALASSVSAISLPPPPTSVPVINEAGSIEIELVGGIKLRVSGAAKHEALRQVIAALEAQ